MPFFMYDICISLTSKTSSEFEQLLCIFQTSLKLMNYYINMNPTFKKASFHRESNMRLLRQNHVPINLVDCT